MILKFFDVAHSTRVSPLSFRWLRPKHPGALSDVFVCPSAFALHSPTQLCNVFVFPGSYQWCCRSCMSLHLSEMSLAHILERSSVGICLLCVGLVLLLWNLQRILCYTCYVVFLFLVYEETYTCLSIVGLRVVQQVATLNSCETFLFSSDFSESYHVPFHVVFFQFIFPFLHVFIF